MRYLLLTGLCALVAPSASAHGLPVTISIDGEQRLFCESLVNYDDIEGQITPFPVGSPTLLRGTIAFHPKQGVVPAGTVFTLDATGSDAHPAALLYWNADQVLPSPVDVLLTRTGITMEISPDDTFVAGGALPPSTGEPGDHRSLTMALPLDAPVGLYGVGFRVSSPGYEMSETFWAIANYGVTDPAAVEQGLAAIARAVPEPRACLLAGVGGLLGLVSLRRARRGRQRLAQGCQKEKS